MLPLCGHCLCVWAFSRRRASVHFWLYFDPVRAWKGNSGIIRRLLFPNSWAAVTVLFLEQLHGEWYIRMTHVEGYIDCAQGDFPEIVVCIIWVRAAVERSAWNVTKRFCVFYLRQRTCLSLKVNALSVSRCFVQSIIQRWSVFNPPMKTQLTELISNLSWNQTIIRLRPPSFSSCGS